MTNNNPNLLMVIDAYNPATGWFCKSPFGLPFLVIAGFYGASLGGVAYGAENVVDLTLGNILAVDRYDFQATSMIERLTVYNLMDLDNSVANTGEIRLDNGNPWRKILILTKNPEYKPNKP